jgi:hypothetical protein
VKKRNLTVEMNINLDIAFIEQNNLMGFRFGALIII